MNQVVKGQSAINASTERKAMKIKESKVVSEEKDVLVERVKKEGTVSSKGLRKQDIEKVVREDCVSMGEVIVEVTSEDSGSIQGGKRKFSDEIDANCSSDKVSSSPKRAHTASSYDARDYQYCIESPRKLKRQVDELTDKVKSMQKKLKNSQWRTRKWRKRVATLTEVVSELKEKNLINNDCATILETTFSGVPREIMKRLVTQKEKKNPGAYPPELRSFAMTLKFYSAKAYNYVQKSFDLGLPCASVIRSWYSSMNGDQVSPKMR